MNKEQLASFPNVSFSDSRIKLVDMTGDGMLDIAFINSGSVSYWPNMGYGKWGKPVQMFNSPKLPFEYNPAHIYMGDLDGDGLADYIYVENNRVTLWINQSGNTWSDPIVINGTPPFNDADSIRIIDIMGNGTAGILWTYPLSPGEHSMYFLDLTGGIKPYLLNSMNNNMGALTQIEYKHSTYYYLLDQKNPATAWRTSLPFPVHVVSKVESIDQVSNGKLTTEYIYHHGYYDGGEREFRGFGRVDQRDTEIFESFNANNLLLNTNFEKVNIQHYNPPTETRNWFHLGPVGPEFGNWIVLDLSNEYWQTDPQTLRWLDSLKLYYESLPRRVQRDAIRSLKGSSLRTELYGLDGSALQTNPYTVTEHLPVFFEVLSLVDGSQNIITQLVNEIKKYPDETIVTQSTTHIFYPVVIVERATQWERGNDPMTHVSMSGNFDNYGQALSYAKLGVPRFGDWRLGGGSTENYLGTMHQSGFIYVDKETQFMIRPLFAKEWDISGNSTTSSIDYLNNAINQTLESVLFPIIGHTISYYDGDHTNIFLGLPYGQIGSYGAHIRNEHLIITNDIVDVAYGTNIPPCFSSGATPDWSAYPSDFVDTLQSLTLGYTYHNTIPYETGYYICPEAKKYDFQEIVPLSPSGMVIATEDAFGNITTIAFDNYWLMQIAITDPLGMVTIIANDYRVMQPNSVTDPNENLKLIAYTPLGLPFKTAIQGKVGENKGDTLDNPTVFIEYNFFNFLNNNQPVWAKTCSRERHYYDDPSSPYIVKVEYSDGHSRLIQARIQAVDIIFGDTPAGDSGLPVDQGSNANAMGYIRDSSAPLNVIVSGWQVYNNKGWVVEKFEPFFDSGFDFIPPGQTPYGEKIQMFYDPRGEVIRTLHPDGTEEKIIFGVPYDSKVPDFYDPTPWIHAEYDANDLSSSLLAFGTPRYSYVDALQRVIKTFEKNIFYNYIDSSNEEQDITMLYIYDVRGNIIKRVDALGRPCPHLANDFNIFDLENKVIKITNIDAGISNSVYDATGRAVFADNSNGASALSGYDELSRPIKIWARDNNSGAYALKHVMEYGDSSGLVSPQNQNLLGKIYRSYDEAGRVETNSYDFKGNSLKMIRKVIDPNLFANAIIVPPPLPAPQVWSVTPYRIDWTGLNTSLLNSIKYTTESEYDALNRITLLTYPAANGDSGNRRVMTPMYNKAGALEKVDLQDYSGGAVTHYVERIAYNARGQRILISMGNDLMIRYAYDTRNFRLLRMKTEKYAIDNTYTGQIWYVPQSGSTKQDFVYSYDSIGNILNISDKTPECGAGGSDSLNRQFYYDALYRILKTTGRENPPTPYNINPFWDNTRDTTAISTTSYCQKYQYDEMGNIQKLNHQTSVSGASFNREFTYSDIGANNKLSSITVWGNTYDFDYDNCGNQILQNLDCNMLWDYANRLYSFYIQAGTSEPTQYAQYCYDSSGQRVMKVVRVAGGAFKVRIYINNIFEEYYEYDSSITFLGYQNEIMVMDEKTRVASNTVGTTYSDPAMGIKFIYPDQIGSSNILCSDTGSIISREEYYPFGETSFGSYSKKRYRFAGKEKDEESGLYNYGARYYLAWTCRFISVDPKAEKYNYWSPYVNAANNPIMLHDFNGESVVDPGSKGASGSKGDSKKNKGTKKKSSVKNKHAHATGSRSEDGTYTVQKGDWLSAIAVRYGITVEELKEINNLKTNELEAGQKLKTISRTKKKLDPKKNNGRVENPIKGQTDGEGLKKESTELVAEAALDEFKDKITDKVAESIVKKLNFPKAMGGFLISPLKSLFDATRGKTTPLDFLKLAFKSNLGGVMAGYLVDIYKAQFDEHFNQMELIMLETKIELGYKETEFYIRNNPDGPVGDFRLRWEYTNNEWGITMILQGKNVEHDTWNPNKKYAVLYSESKKFDPKERVPVAIFRIH